MTTGLPRSAFSRSRMGEIDREQTALQHKGKHISSICVFTGSAQSASICQAPEAAVFAGGKLCRGPVLLARTRCV